MATKAPTDAPASEHREGRRPLLPPFSIEDDPAPLYISSPEGAVRVRGTRIPLETVVRHYEQGDSPEDIVEQFPTLELADVYATIAYFLRHRPVVSAYLDQLQAIGEQNIGELEAASPWAEVRARLLARLVERQGQADDAPAGG